MVSVEEMAKFCKDKGFVYSSGELYGGLSGFFDYGPLGVEVKNNLKQSLWKTFVQSRQDVLGIDGAIITHPKVWKASGHTDHFADIVLSCTKCDFKARADQFLEEQLKTSFDGVNAKQVNEHIEKHKLNCPKCKSDLKEATDFNLMFETHVGPSAESSAVAYLRPETAQLIFADFKLLWETSRVKLPFGVAQAGKAFRNEISPRDFMFRSREFEQFEIEFFTHPDKTNECGYFESIKNEKVQILTAEAQENKGELKEMTFEEVAKLTTTWHAYWMQQFLGWFVEMGIDNKNLRLREHKKSELAHYAGACFDIEYKFPFGWKEIHGNANRGQYDLGQHAKVSGKDLTVFDEESKSKVLPAVASEPSQGIDRAFLAFMFEAYEDDKKRGNLVMHLHTSLAPVKVGVFPLVNKLDEESRKVFEMLRQDIFVQFDRSGSVGRRYARADEIGIPYTVTFDFESLDDKSVTIRDRESTDQVRVPIKELKDKLQKLLAGELPFQMVGKAVETKKTN